MHAKARRPLEGGGGVLMREKAGERTRSHFSSHPTPPHPRPMLSCILAFQISSITLPGFLLMGDDKQNHTRAHTQLNCKHPHTCEPQARPTHPPNNPPTERRAHQGHGERTVCSLRHPSRRDATPWRDCWRTLPPGGAPPRLSGWLTWSGCVAFAAGGAGCEDRGSCGIRSCPDGLRVSNRVAVTLADYEIGSSRSEVRIARYGAARLEQYHHEKVKDRYRYEPLKNE